MHHRGYSGRHRYGERGNGRALAALLALTAGTVVVLCARSLIQARPILQPEDAPRHTWRRHTTAGRRESAVVGRSVTINRPREEVYARWRDFSSFPDFMENVRSVTALDEKRSRWVVEAPGGRTVTFETTITEERPNELIAWESDEDAQIRNSGRVTFRDAPGGRGTVVEATIAYDPPAGAAGQVAAKLFQREPNIQARRELKRFKQLMESGEIAVAEAGRAAPRA